MIVQHNLQAMNANRMLGVTTKQVSGSTEKLSSGYRINRAADDAAGLAISEKMRKQIRGLTQASSNAEDGISCVQTAEGALAEVQDMLQRMNELAVQAANGTNSETDRQYIQDEFDQLISEIDRVAETTKFNETYLLKGDNRQPTKSVYITNYSTTYTKNQYSNAVGSNPNIVPLTYKVNYTGSNNIMIADVGVLTTSPNISVATTKVQKGEDITKFMTYSKRADNEANAGLNTSSYVAFVNVELNSNVKKGNNGEVYGAIISDSPTAAELQKYGLTGKTADELETENLHTDLSTNGIDETVRASRTLYVYNTENSTTTRLTAGSDMTEYLNDDNTMKDKYRLVDILDGESNATFYIGESKDYYSVDSNGNYDSKTFRHGEDRTDLYKTITTSTTTPAYFGETGQKLADVLTGSTTIPEGTYVVDKSTSTIYRIDADTSINSTSVSAKAVILSNVDGSTTVDTTVIKIMTTDLQSDQYVIVNEDTTFLQNNFLQVEDSTSLRVKEQMLGNNAFTWSNNEIQYDYSMQKLYDANGQEISGVALNKFFDENGNYTGGLFTTSQARAIDEVFATEDSDAYKKIKNIFGDGVATTIGRYITQSSSQVAAALNVQLHAGSDSDRNNKIEVELSTLTSAGLGIDKLASYNIGIVDSTGDNATDAIDVIADALNKVSRQRSALGAVQNRLEHTIKNLDNVVENTTSAEAQIRDTNMAEEMVKYSNANILQQAGQSMLAQANQANQGVLSLLQ